MQDLISRQAVIDELKRISFSHCFECGEYLSEDTREIEIISSNKALEVIEALPSAQPELCVNTIDALNESIKHFDDMAEECRRNANIERNDYMDMRDDAAEYRQLSIWLNELKWLRERFQSQPEIIHCKDCKYYSPMNKETKTGICNLTMHQNFGDNWFCAGAERRTDE